MGSRKLEELYREFDAYEDDDLMEAMEEAYKLGCKEGKRKAMVTMITMNFVVIGHVEVVTVMERDAV